MKTSAQELRQLRESADARDIRELEESIDERLRVAALSQLKTYTAWSSTDGDSYEIIEEPRPWYSLAARKYRVEIKSPVGSRAVELLRERGLSPKVTADKYVSRCTVWAELP